VNHEWSVSNDDLFVPSEVQLLSHSDCKNGSWHQRRKQQVDAESYTAASSLDKTSGPKWPRWRQHVRRQFSHHRCHRRPPHGHWTTSMWWPTVTTMMRKLLSYMLPSAQWQTTLQRHCPTYRMAALAVNVRPDICHACWAEKNPKGEEPTPQNCRLGLLWPVSALYSSHYCSRHVLMPCGLRS